MAYACGHYEEIRHPATTYRSALFPAKSHSPVRAHSAAVVGPTRASRGVSGSVRNISSSGLCLLGQKRLKISELLVVRITVPGTRASIPTLLQVRWLRKNSVGPRYMAGLQFVLQGSISEALQTSTGITDLRATGEAIRRTSPR